MLIDVECQRCRGEGWLLRHEPLLGSGLYEVTCDLCDGHGYVEEDVEDEVEDWMREA